MPARSLAWVRALRNQVRVVLGRVKKNRGQGTNKVVGIFFSKNKTKNILKASG